MADLNIMQALMTMGATEKVVMDGLTATPVSLPVTKRVSKTFIALSIKPLLVDAPDICYRRANVPRIVQISKVEWCQH